MELVLDVGNSRTKLALFGGGALTKRAVVANGDRPAMEEFLGGAKPKAIAVGSVAKENPALLEFLSALAPLLVVAGDTPAPIRTRYTHPSTLGADRLANAVWGAGRFPGRPALVIDAGTCITYDVVSAAGEHLGGAISPGLRMRAKALKDFSARLPLVDPTEPRTMIATDTDAALRSGIHQGIVGEMRSFIAHCSVEHPGLAVALTGGEGLRWARALKSGIFAHPYATLEGLHAILLHHRAGRPSFAAPTRGAQGPGHPG
jgi:type III pantothenate kinase